MVFRSKLLYYYVKGTNKSHQGYFLKGADTMIYAYLRVSTKHQSIERQRANIKERFPEAVMIEEVCTGGGSMDARDCWKKLNRRLKAGDTVVFDSVSRMSRNAEEGYTTYLDLYNRGVELEFIREPHLDTKVFRSAAAAVVPMTGGLVDGILQAVNDFLLAMAKQQIEIGFQQAEKELTDNHTRTREGIAAKKRRNEELKTLYPDTFKDHPEYTSFREPAGQKLTTKKSVKAKEIIRKHNKSFGGPLDDKETAALAGVCINSLYTYKRQLRAKEI